MPRLDPYTHFHKAIRALLFDALLAVGRTEPQRESELPALIASVRRALRLLQAHARHEDGELHPVLHRHAPELAADLEAGHDRLDGLGREVEADLARLTVGTLAERVSLCRRLQERLGELTALALRHMALEESRASRVLWAHADDAELAARRGRILAAMEQAELEDWIEWMAVAGRPSECTVLLNELRGTVPAETFLALTAAARASMGEERWRECLAGQAMRAGPEVAPAGARP